MTSCPSDSSSRMVHPPPCGAWRKYSLETFLQRRKPWRGRRIDEAASSEGSTREIRACVNVGFFLFAGGRSILRSNSFLSINQSDAQLLFLSCIH